tara:strand:- start:174 stop:785 length:612 start_codon:yes stop_codon:yes gene_type:complete
LTSAFAGLYLDLSKFGKTKDKALQRVQPLAILSSRIEQQSLTHILNPSLGLRTMPSVKNISASAKSTKTSAAKTKAKSKAATKTTETKSAPKAKSKTVQPAPTDKDLQWNQKKVDVFLGMKKVKAFGKTDARSASDIADAADCSIQHVRYYCSHAVISGHVGIIDVEGVRGNCYFLTAKGKKVDPKAALKKRIASGVRSKWMD